MQIDVGAQPPLPADHTEDSSAFTRGALRAFRIAMPVAVVAVILAIALNWWFAPGAGEALPGPGAVVAGGGVPDPGEITLDKPALDMLPNRILQYETITRQAIPGYGERGAEAIYKTLNMNMAAQISTVTYARAEAFASEAEAQSRLEELMRPYTIGTGSESIGGIIANVGLSTDKGAYAKGWTQGRYVVYVKSSFDEWIAEYHPEIIEAECDRIATDVELYQRTGQEGVQAR